MSLKRITPLSSDGIFLARYIKRIETMTIRHLCYIGEVCINIGRSTNSYKDQTGNLRNSIGYVVINDGKIVTKATTHENRNNGGKNGTKEGEEFIDKLIAKHSRGVCLIVVAGMNYASYVSASGRDVLDSAELEAERLIEQLRSNLK